MGQWGRFSQIKHEAYSEARSRRSLGCCQVFGRRRRPGGERRRDPIRSPSMVRISADKGGGLERMTSLLTPWNCFFPLLDGHFFFILCFFLEGRRKMLAQTLSDCFLDILMRFKLEGEIQFEIIHKGKGFNSI